MSSQGEVLEMLARANPVPDPDIVTMEPDANRYLAGLLDDSVQTHHNSAMARSVGSPRWRLAAVAASIIVVCVLGLVVVAGRDPDSLAPAAGESPLDMIRSPLAAGADVEVFRVRADAASYWRLTTLPGFDGERWFAPANELGYIGDDDGGAREGRELRQEIEIRALTGTLVPVAPEPVNATATDDLRWSQALGALVAMTELAPGDRFDVVSTSPEFTAEELRAATTNDPPASGYVDLPDTVPASLLRTVDAVTAGAATDYDRLVVLQRWFQAEFEYSTDVQTGHGYAAIETLLRTRVGSNEQFASTFAVLARTLGIPSRVAVGFTSGELRSDGWYSVANRNSHAWPEIWFDGIGWTPFEPTPPRNAPTPTTEALDEAGAVADPVPASMEWAFGHWIFRVQPDMWPALFGDTDSPQEATEQTRLRTQWYERFDEQCSDIPHVDVAEPCGTAVPAPPIPAEHFADLDRRLEDAGWTEINEGWGYEGCDVLPFDRYLFAYQEGASGWAIDRASFGAETTRVHGSIPLLRLSVEQAKIVGDQIVDLIDCDDLSTTFPDAAEPVQIEELPASIPARGVIVGDSYAIFAVTTSRGGLAWMSLSGAVTVDTVSELANTISEFLDEVIE